MLAFKLAAIIPTGKCLVIIAKWANCEYLAVLLQGSYLVGATRCAKISFHYSVSHLTMAKKI